MHKSGARIKGYIFFPQVGLECTVRITTIRMHGIYKVMSPSTFSLFWRNGEIGLGFMADYSTCNNTHAVCCQLAIS